MKLKTFKIMLTYANGKTETISVKLASLNDAYVYCQKINAETTMTAQIVGQKKEANCYVR